ncbi:MAG: DUF2284 domain-containing protein [candidate division KSB1 bacterium]|nr:DUF2284 domain-containing protein [candidate division KSB1 bacterium]
MEKYIRQALEGGATFCREIPVSAVSVAEWVRVKCQFGCGGYGECLTCPPYSPTPAVTRRWLSEYHRALLLRFDRNPAEREEEVRLLSRKLGAELERQLFLDGFYKAFALGAGPCPFCDTCDTTRPCIHPRLARPAMEACGIDVYATVRNLGLKLEVVTSEQACYDLVSLVLVD